jgi:tetratricopeptide (TPR) repeat protein
MTRVFISYSQRHRDLTHKLAQLLEREGYSVWWDHSLESRGPFWTQIRAALDAADVIVVVWTVGATSSDYVYAEAVRAYNSGKLVQLRPADLLHSEVPEPFNVYHLDEIDLERPTRILASIAAAASGKPVATRVSLADLFSERFGYDLLQSGQEPLTADGHDFGPADLLDARHGAVPFVVSSNTKQGFIDWCLDAERAVAGRLLFGPGGLGKTRLLTELAAELRAIGWKAGFLADPALGVADQETRLRQQAVEQLLWQSDQAGVLIVLDYAEGRQQELEWLVGRLDARRKQQLPPLRLVLLTRGDGLWWQRLVDTSAGIRRTFFDRKGRPDVHALAPIPPGPQRVAFLNEAIRVFRPFMAQINQSREGAPADDILDPDRLQRLESDPEFGRPLALQMEALVNLASVTGGPAGGIEGLIDRVIALERRHWQRLLGPIDDARELDLRRGISQVTLIGGGLASAATQRLLMKDRYYKREAPEHARPVVDQLQRIFSAPDGSIRAIQPDLLGEHEAAQTSDDDLLTGCVEWIETEVQPERLVTFLTVLQRATQPEHGDRVRRAAEDRLAWALKHQAALLAPHLITVVRSTPGTLQNVIERSLPILSREAVQKLNAAMPLVDVRLLKFGLGLSERLVAITHVDDEAGAASEAIAAHAGALNEHGVRLSLLGRHKDALEAAQRSVDLYQRVVKSGQQNALPNLASALNNLSQRQAAHERFADALAMSRQADAIYTALVAIDPEAFELDAARSKSTLAARLTDVGDHAVAISTNEAVIAYWRERSSSHAAEPARELGRALISHGKFLIDAKKFDAGDKAVGEATAIFRNVR